MKPLARSSLFLVLLISCFLLTRAQGFNPASSPTLFQSSDTFSSWKKVSPEGAGFSIKFPGEPRSKEMIGTIEASAGKTLQLLQFDGGSIFYQITYFPISPAEAQQIQSKIKEEITKQDAAKVKDKLGSDILDQRGLMIGAYPARDILNTGQVEGYGRTLSVASDTHFYVIALGTKTLEAIRSREAEYFLKSFTLQTGTPASSTTAQTFTSVEGGFTISLPQKPSVQRTEPIAAGNRSLEFHIFHWVTSSGEYSVGYMDMPRLLEDPAISKAILDNARDSGIKKENGKLLGERDLSLDGHVGREFKIAASDGIFIDRVYLVKQRFYSLSVFIPTAKLAEEATANKVFDSFKFIKE